MLLRLCSDLACRWQPAVPQLRVGDAQVAGVDEADELRRLVIQQRVRADRVGRGSPGVGEARPDVGVLLVAWRRVAAVAVDAAEPDGRLARADRAPRWHVMQPRLLAAASDGSCRERSKTLKRGGDGVGFARRWRRGNRRCRREPRRFRTEERFRLAGCDRVRVIGRKSKVPDQEGGEDEEDRREAADARRSLPEFARSDITIPIG